MAPRARRILIADDDAVLREIAAAMLEQAGYSVVTAASGDAALAACAVQMPDLVLLDVEMPGGDGYQACANVRALAGGKRLPIVMITGLEDPASIDHAYRAGATDFIVKPINWPLLVRRLEYILKSARTLNALRESREQSAALLRLMPDGLFVVDARGSITRHVSPTRGLMRRTRGAPPQYSTLLELLPEHVHGAALRRLARATGGSAAALEFSLGDNERGLRSFECRLLPKSSGEVLVVLRDVTQRKDSEGRMRRLAYVDALTGLANREWIKVFLNKVLARAERRQGSCAVLFIDLDGFKRVNDTLGHESGDALLAQVAGRLRSALGYCRRRPEREDHPGAEMAPVSAQIARLGGDEFVVVLTGTVTSASAETAARSVQAELQGVFSLGGYEVSITPSIGIALSPQHGADAKMLLKSADEAMYLAKSGGRNQYRFYDDSLKARALLRASLQDDLRAAIGTAQLRVVYQPVYESRTLRIVGAEALLRWVHPQHGEIANAELMVVAEETGLICELDAWVVRQACEDLRCWRAQGVTPERLSVNVSARDFLRPEMALRMSNTIEEAQLPNSQFELDVPEAVLMHDGPLARRTLLALKELGFGLAMDDFGSGQCSFSSLRRLPIDMLKISASFIEDVPKDPGNLAIIRAIIVLSRKLRMRVVGKGVATIAQLQFLREERCDLVQGFLLSPPVSAERFCRLVLDCGPDTQTVRALQLAIDEREEAAEADSPG